MWEDGECWIIGGGPSITKEFDIPGDLVQSVKAGDEPLSAYSPYMDKIHDRHIIGVNIAFLLGNWIEVAFFGDGGFFLKNRKDLANYTGLKVSCSPKINSVRFKTDNIKYLTRDRDRPRGISRNPHKVSWNSNSGAAAISLAAHTGVKRIILLGFDMKCAADNSQHWHNKYGRSPGQEIKRPHRLPFRRHLLGFPQIAKDAEKMGIEILNASPDSEIDVFKKVKVKEL